MKLFLASLAIDDHQALELAKLVGKDQKDIKLALIENAADTYTGSPAWVENNRRMIQSHGFDVEIIDLKEYPQDLEALHTKLSEKDVIWFGGGNTYYLRWLLRDTRIENIIKDLVANGKIYGGGSAGAIVAGPTLKHFETADDPAESPGVVYEGLGFTDSVVVPHFNNDKFAHIIRAINDQLIVDGYKTVPLGDQQALIVEDGKERVV